MTGPYAVVVRFRAHRAGDALNASPEQIHAAFLGLVRRGDPALAHLLHAQHLGRRPFSLWPLGRPGQDGVLSLRLSVLAPELLHRFWERWERRGGFPLHLCEHTLHPEKVEHEGPWAGTAAWRDLASRTTERTVRLQFCTPTTFRQGDLDLPLPLPRLVFGGLLARWNAFAPLSLPLNMETVDRRIALADAHIRVRTFFDGRARIPGCVGWAEFRALRGMPPEAVAAVQALADFAFFAGVGRKTTHGMGLVRRAS